MMKITNILAAMALMVGSTAAMAIPTLGDVMDGSPFDRPEYDTIYDSGDETFVLTDVDGNDDDATGLFVIEFAGYADSNTSFIYDLTDSTNRVTIFDGADTANDSVVLTFALATDTWDNGGAGVVFGSGEEFGVGLTSPDGTFFSQSALNPNGDDFLLTFETEGQGGVLGAFEITFAWEDVVGLGDMDYNDHVFAATDIVGFAVPAPAPLALLGLGMIGMIGARKLRK